MLNYTNAPAGDDKLAEFAERILHKKREEPVIEAPLYLFEDYSFTGAFAKVATRKS